MLGPPSQTSRRPQRLAGAVLTAAAALAQAQPSGPAPIAVEVAEEIPLQVAATDFEDTEFESRGGALVIDLAGSITFRHDGLEAVRALTLAVDAHEGKLGGRAAVAVPSLHAMQGELFEVRLSVRLLRPLPRPPGPAVRIAVDGVLFDSLAAVGPDRLDSVRKMTVRELEARRDRRYFLSRLDTGGRAALVEAMQASLRRQAERPRLEVHLAGDGPATAPGRGDTRELQLALVQDPHAPLVLERGSALVHGAVSDSPRIVLRNRSPHLVGHFEIGWLVRDGQGVLYSAGTAPGDPPPALRPGARFATRAEQRFSLRPVGLGGAAELAGMAAFLRSVQLGDGSVWIPSRSALDGLGLLDAVPVSAEEQRLTRLYRERGPDVVSAELRKLTP